MVDVFFLNQYVFAIAFKYGSTAITTDPVDKQLCHHAANRAKNDGSQEIDLPLRHEESPVGQNDFARDDFQHQPQHDSEISKTLNPVE
ncbi:hypothetical protein D1872_295920 [compost metagenome]